MKHDNVLHFLCDELAYMVKIEKAICSLYSKMVHVTCIMYAVCRIVEEMK